MLVQNSIEVLRLKQRNGFQLKEIVLIIIATAFITSLTTGVIMYNNSRITNHVSNADLNNDENLKEFIKVYASLIGDYYSDIDSKAMLEEAMSAMFNYLGEDYSDYLSKDESNALAEHLLGEYMGIGVQIIEGNVIFNVFDDSPAKTSGLEKNDVIVSLNGEEITDENKSNLASKIQRVTTGKIDLAVLRNGERLNFSVEIKKMMVPAVHAQLVPNLEKKIAYLAISTFSNTVAKQFKDALEKLEKDGLESLIIDLRGNSGGYLSQATEIASMFLERDKVIYSLADKNETKVYKDETDEKRDYPVIILMNEGSASASEILAAALKDSYGVTLIGETSYGKGKVQQTKTLEDGSMVKYTTARWIRPNGDCVDGVGINPDIEVILELPKNGETVIDTQLQEAILRLNQ